MILSAAQKTFDALFHDLLEAFGGGEVEAHRAAELGGGGPAGDGLLDELITS